MRFAVTDQQLIHGAFLDFAKAGVALAPGGIYRAKMAEQEIVFKIDADAKPGDVPLVGAFGAAASAKLIAANSGA